MICVHLHYLEPMDSRKLQRDCVSAEIVHVELVHVRLKLKLTNFNTAGPKSELPAFCEIKA